MFVCAIVDACCAGGSVSRLLAGSREMTQGLHVVVSPRRARPTFAAASACAVGGLGHITPSPSACVLGHARGSVLLVLGVLSIGRVSVARRLSSCTVKWWSRAVPCRHVMPAVASAWQLVAGTRPESRSSSSARGFHGLLHDVWSLLAAGACNARV